MNFRGKIKLFEENVKQAGDCNIQIITESFLNYGV